MNERHNEEIWRFIKGLSRTELQHFVAAYADGIPFYEARERIPAHVSKCCLPEYLQNVVDKLDEPKTARELANIFDVSLDTIWTYLTKIRGRGIRIETDFKYGKTTYRVR